MKNIMRLITAILFACTGTLACAQPGEWRITPYAWVAGFDGTLGTEQQVPGIGGRIQVDTDSLSDNMKLGGAMLHFSWRRDRWTAFGDWTYASVKTDTPTPFGVLYSSADAKLKGHIVEAYGGYDLLGTKDAHMDVFGGVRYYNLKIELGLRDGVLPGVSVSQDDDWIDGVVGVRGSARFAGNWELFASADVGGGGSDFSWQLFGGIGYHWSWGAVVGGWRHLHIDYEKRGFKLDAAISGPFIGASFQF